MICLAAWPPYEMDLLAQPAKLGLLSTHPPTFVSVSHVLVARLPSEWLFETYLT